MNDDFASGNQEKHGGIVQPDLINGSYIFELEITFVFSRLQTNGYWCFKPNFRLDKMVEWAFCMLNRLSFSGCTSPFHCNGSKLSSNLFFLTFEGYLYFRSSFCVKIINQKWWLGLLIFFSCLELYVLKSFANEYISILSITYAVPWLLLLLFYFI